MVDCDEHGDANADRKLWLPSGLRVAGTGQAFASPSFPKAIIKRRPTAQMPNVVADRMSAKRAA